DRISFARLREWLTTVFSRTIAEASRVTNDIIVKTTKPLRQDQRSTNQASGVADKIMPLLLIAKTSPEMPAKRAAGQCLDVNTIAANKACAQHMPSRVSPTNSHLMLGTTQQIPPPKIAAPENATIVWRTPNMSSDNPPGICINAKLQ